ncbi:MAG: TRAM domain-containing protein [Clostridiaceae bacterium]|nr:TRAM domain-containing protein [Clostridiaceae bacterium]
MLNNIIKFSFAAVGCITGITITRTFFIYQLADINPELKTLIFLVVAVALGIIFYMGSNKLIEIVMEALDRMELLIQRLTLYELTISSIGLIIGLVIANLVTIPIKDIDIIGTPVSIAANILFSCLGIAVAAGKKNENFFSAIKGKALEGSDAEKKSIEPKILDTSVIIDGRIVDICRSGFIDGELIVPSFVLDELRHIADSQDPLKRNRGRRGLDVLNMIQKDLKYPTRIENGEVSSDAEVDSALLKMAQKLDGKVLTIDFNLNKVANFQGVSVLNINELANALKPIALPGEDITVQVIKDGKENGQGVAYLDDGTMIVIDGGRRHIGESLNVTVTSILQTAAGRMIFAKPKYSIERVI